MCLAVGSGCSLTFLLVAMLPISAIIPCWRCPMRLTGLLALLLFVLIVFYAAPAASFAQTANTPAVKSDNTESDSLAVLPEKLQLVRNRVSERPLVASQPLMEHN